MRPSELSDIISESPRERRARHRVQREATALGFTPGVEARNVGAGTPRRPGSRRRRWLVVRVLLIAPVVALIRFGPTSLTPAELPEPPEPPAAMVRWADLQVETVTVTGELGATVPQGAEVRVGEDRMLSWTRESGACWAVDVSVVDAALVVVSGRSGSSTCGFVDAMDTLGANEWHQR